MLIFDYNYKFNFDLIWKFEVVGGKGGVELFFDVDFNGGFLGEGCW